MMRVVCLREHGAKPIVYRHKHSQDYRENQNRKPRIPLRLSLNINPLRCDSKESRSFEMNILLCIKI